MGSIWLEMRGSAEETAFSFCDRTILDKMPELYATKTSSNYPKCEKMLKSPPNSTFQTIALTVDPLD